MGKTQETVLAVLKKCPQCLVYVWQYANIFSVGPCLYFINREDRSYNKFLRTRLREDRRYKENDTRKYKCHFYVFSFNVYKFYIFYEHF